MAETQSTILIPDISGFTEFMTSTELSHSSQAINMLIDAIINAVGEEYEVSEIEGDAVLLIKKGPAPTQKQILEICLKIFNAFHFQRKWMMQHRLCPCGACNEIINLTLKFVVHHGPLAEMKVGRFVKQSGIEMIVAHRLLKNSISNNEYLLVTEKLLQQAPDSSDTIELNWTSSSEEYASIGKVDYRFALLSEARKKVPEPPEPENRYRTDDTPYNEMQIAANFRDVYMILMNIPQRAQLMPGLLKVEQEIPDVFVGSTHLCTFNNFKAVLSPLCMVVSDTEILFAESCKIVEMNVSLVHEYIFRQIDDKNCLFAWRIMNMQDSVIPGEIYDPLFKKMQLTADKLKEHCEKLETSLFEPVFQNK